MDSQPSAENDDSSFSVILEGAVRLSSGIHKGASPRVKAYGLWFIYGLRRHPPPYPLPSREGEIFLGFSLFFNGLF